MSATAANPALPVEAPRKSRKLVLIVAAVAVLAAGGGGAWWWMGRGADGAHAKPAAAPALYHPMEPVFVVNLADPDGSKYLQVEVQLMTRDPDALAQLAQHAPRIRNRLLLLYGQQHSAGLRTRADKERLQKESLAEVQAILKSETGKPGVEAVYFTSFVTQ